MSSAVTEALVEPIIASNMAESIILAQPSIQELYLFAGFSRGQLRLTAEELSLSRWGFVVTNLHLLADDKSQVQPIARRLFVEASQKAYQELLTVDPYNKLVLPAFLSISNDELREQVAIYYLEEAI